MGCQNRNSDGLLAAGMAVRKAWLWCSAVLLMLAHTSACPPQQLPPCAQHNPCGARVSSRSLHALMGGCAVTGERMPFGALASLCSGMLQRRCPATIGPSPAELCGTVLPSFVCCLQMSRVTLLTLCSWTTSSPPL